MSDVVVDEALRAASPLLEHGYQAVDHRVYEQHFGSGWVLLAKDQVRLRIVNDRGVWFVEIGSTAAPGEWFDARLVLSEIGARQVEEGTDNRSLEAQCRVLAQTSPKWEVLFLPATFATARESLRSRETALATDRFGRTS